VRYRFTRVVAGLDVAIGVILILAGVAVGIAAFVIPSQQPLWLKGANPLFDKIAIAAVAVLAGLLLGAIFIVAGQLTLAFLNIERRLARIDRRLRLWAQSPSPEEESKWTDRLRPR
jgi:hypothetical protein